MVTQFVSGVLAIFFDYIYFYINFYKNVHKCIHDKTSQIRKINGIIVRPKLGISLVYHKCIILDRVCINDKTSQIREINGIIVRPKFGTSMVVLDLSLLCMYCMLYMHNLSFLCVYMHNFSHRLSQIKGACLHQKKTLLAF